MTVVQNVNYNKNLTDEYSHANLISDAGIISKKYQQRALVKPDSLVNSKSNSFSPGDVVIGTVFKLEPEGALINIGSEIAAYIPLWEMSIVEVESPDEVLQLNETRQFLVVREYDDQENNPRLSLSIRALERRIAWERVRQMQAENVTVYATVYALHSGGAPVKIEGLGGLIPSSYICTDKPKENLVGEEFPLKFLKVEEERDRLWLSHRSALFEPTIKKLKVGDVVVGWIRTLKPYGAWVDIEDASALLHIAEISHDPFDDLHSVFQVNDEVKVMILDLDILRGRISVSTKQLEPEPGDMLKNPQLVYEKAEEMAAKYRLNPHSVANSKSNSLSPGEIVTGTVFKLEPEGAWIDLGSEIAAYIPLREMSIVEVESPDEVLQLNETRQFLVVDEYSDQENHPILSLSIRALERRIAWERVRQLQAENLTVYAIVYAITLGGAWVQIEGLRGLIPRSHLYIPEPKEDVVGKQLPLKFLVVDEERNGLSLSHRIPFLEPKIKKLKVGDVVVGWIRTLKPYGAIVDLGDVSALLRISEISHAHVDTSHSVFQVNDKVKAMIVDVDVEKGRISVSTKQLEPEPGDMLKNPQLVYEKAEEMAAKYRQQMQERQKDFV